VGEELCDEVGEDVGTEAVVPPADDEDEDELDEDESEDDESDDVDGDVLPDVVDVGTVVTTEESSVAGEPLGAAA
jgi:hypothetical protein